MRRGGGAYHAAARRVAHVRDGTLRPLERVLARARVSAGHPREVPDARDAVGGPRDQLPAARVEREVVDCLFVPPPRRPQHLTVARAPHRDVAGVGPDRELPGLGVERDGRDAAVGAEDPDSLCDVNRYAAPVVPTYTSEVPQGQRAGDGRRDEP